MKKTLLCMLLSLCLALGCQTALAAGDARLPAQVSEILCGPAWDGYAVTQVDDLAEWGARDTVAAVLTRGERNVLCLFAKREGGWKLAVQREKALYAGEQDIRLQFPDETHFVIYYEFGERAEDYWFTAADAAKTRWAFEKARLWHDRRVNPQNGDVTAEIVEVTPTKDGLAYRSYRFASGKAETQISGWTHVRGVIHTELHAFNIATFPKSLAQAQKKLSLPPALPAAREGALPEGKTPEFKPDQRYPVYSGPSAAYTRAANGKASVSTNDWIQVFGREGDMALIQYAISSEKARFGYIDAAALQKADAVDALAFASQPVTLAAGADLTDDPLFSREAVLSLSAGEQVRYLAGFGEEWAYIETLSSPQTRGFIPAAALEPLK